jgi:predicted nucleic acid-binding protein
MSRVFWDTNLFIYLFESSGALSKQVASLRSRMLVRGDQLLTSAMTLGEVLVKPVQSGDSKTADYYQKLITTTAVLLPFEEKAALVYARLRADRSLRPPDAIQLACAASAGVDLFITNDLHLHSRQIPGIQFIAPLDRIPI